MFNIIVKGAIIGILVSAPVGPMGMLVIQRTLNRDRWHGFFTAVGVLTSDLIYALVTLLGVGVFSSFLDNEESYIRTVGSIVLLLLGMVIFQKNPLKEWTPASVPSETRYARDYVTAFMMSITNMGVMLVFVTLYAHFQFNPVADGTGELFTAMLSMAIGALVWWFFITGMISRLRVYFNRRGLLILNRMVGTILMGIGLTGLIILLFEKLHA